MRIKRDLNSKKTTINTIAIVNKIATIITKLNT